MEDLGVAFFAFAIAFGALMGFGLGRRAEDRTPSLAACVTTAALGVVAWLVGTPGTDPATAGAAMTVGGLSALIVLMTAGRRELPAR
jgi:hypothetical protein